MIDTKKNLKDLKIGVKRKQQNVLTQPQKKIKKLESGSEEVVEVLVQKKTPKMPTVFKKGKWNPQTKLVEKSEELERSSKSA